MSTVEIYTKTFCPYCWRAKELLAAKGVDYHEVAVDFGGEAKQLMVAARERAGRPSRRSSSTGHHVGGCDDLSRSIAPASSTSCSRKHDPDRALPGAAAGSIPARMRGRWSMPSREAAAGRRGDAVHAGNVGPARPRPRARAARICASRTRIWCWPRCREAAKAHRHLGPSRLARRAGRRRQARQPRLRDRPRRARSARATTRSICSTSTCRPARAGGNPRSTQPGKGAVLVDGTPVGKLGLTICYDLRFPGLFERLSEAGADVDRGAGRLHRADRPGALARAAARAGDRGRAVRRRRGAGRAARGRPRRPIGHSLVVDPWGEVLLDMGERARGSAFAEIDLARIAEVRARIPALSHRRADPRRGNDLIARLQPLFGRGHGSVAQQDRASVS